MYKAQGQLTEFEKIKPKLTEQQVMLANAFNRLGHERDLDQGYPVNIKEKDIRYYQYNNGSCCYASDLFIMAIRALDDDYIVNYYEKLKRKSKKG